MVLYSCSGHYPQVEDAEEEELWMLTLAAQMKHLQVRWAGLGAPCVRLDGVALSRAYVY